MENKIEALKEAALYIEKLEKAANIVIGDIKKEQNDDVYRIIAQMAEGMEWLLSIFNLTLDVQVQKIGTTNVTHIIKNMIEGLENKDFILLQETLEYELVEQLNEWKRLIDINLSL